MEDNWRNTINEEDIDMEAKKYPHEVLHLATFEAVGKYTSVRRDMRRGHVAAWGSIIPKRPFNNRKRTPGRQKQLEKEVIYRQLKYGNRGKGV